MPEPYTAHPDPSGPLRHGSALEAVAVLEALEARIELALQQDASLAVQLAREALHLAGTLNSPGSVARAGSLLGAALYVHAQYAEAEAVLLQALNGCDELADAPGQRRCLAYLGYLNHASGRHAEAIVYFLRLMALAHSADRALRPEDAQLHRAEAHSGLSMVYSDLGDTASSLEHQLEALALQRQQADKGGLGMALSNISVDYRDLGQLNESAQYCREALEMARSVGDVRTETAALSNLGLTCLAQGRPEEAAPLFERLLELARQAGLPRRVMWGLHGMAELQLAHGLPELALPHLYEALSISQERVLRSEEIDTWLLLGRSQLEGSRSQGNRSEGHLQALAAVASLERALQLAQETRNLQAESKARLALSDAQEQAGEPVQALAQLRAYLTLKGGRESALTEQRAQVLAVRFGAEESRRENERLQAHARQMEDSAHRDALTGLLNRRGLEPRLEAALVWAQSSGAPLCLAVLDLDQFKQVNDRHSHQVGDEVLRAAAQLFLAGCRSSDRAGVGRYGGEEFVILLPGIALEAAAKLLERLRCRVQDHPWAQLHPGLAVTVSIGVAQLKAETPSVAALVAAAHACMYAAKSAGRNRVVAA